MGSLLSLLSDTHHSLEPSLCGLSIIHTSLAPLSLSLSPNRAEVVDGGDEPPHLRSDVLQRWMVVTSPPPMTLQGGGMGPL